MFNYIFRGISVMVAVLYTATSLCIRSVPPPETDAHATVLPSENFSGNEKRTAVRILQNREDIGLVLQQALDLYKERNIEAISFSVQTITSKSDYHSALRVGLLSNDAADLFQISSTREYFELEKYIRELDYADWIMSAYESSLDAVSHNGHIYGIPYSIEAAGLICRKDAFDVAEVSPENIRSLSDLDEAFAKIREQIESGNSEALIGMEHVTELAASDKDFLAAKLVDIVLSGEFSTAEEAAVSKSVEFPAAEQVEEFVKIMAKYSGSRSNWTKLTKITDAQQIESFANGRVAVILHDTNVYKRINEINPSMHGQMLLLPIPLDIFEQPSIYMGVPLYWTVNAVSSDKAVHAATSFLEWLYTSDEGSALFADKFGDVSAFRGFAKGTGVSLHSQMLSYISADMAMPQFNREYSAGWSKNVFAPNIQSYFTQREKTWAQVIKDCVDGWQLEATHNPRSDINGNN